MTKTYFTIALELKNVIAPSQLQNESNRLI